MNTETRRIKALYEDDGRGVYIRGLWSDCEEITRENTLFYALVKYDKKIYWQSFSSPNLEEFLQVQDAMAQAYNEAIKYIESHYGSHRNVN